MFLFVVFLSSDSVISSFRPFLKCKSTLNIQLNIRFSNYNIWKITNVITQRTQKTLSFKLSKPTTSFPKSVLKSAPASSRSSMSQAPKKKYNFFSFRSLLRLGKCQVPSPSWQTPWQRVHHADQRIFPVLQHGLHKLRLRLRSQHERGGQARSPCIEAGNRQARTRSTLASHHSGKK